MLANYAANPGSLSGSGKTGSNDPYVLHMGNYDTTISAFGILVLRDDDVDNSAIIKEIAESGTPSRTVTIGRTFVHGEWNSISLPFNVNAGKVKELFGDDTQLKQLSGSSFSEGALALTFVDVSLSSDGQLAIYAGKPYLIKPSQDADVVNPVFGKVTIVNSSTPIVTTVATFTPVINPTTFTARDMTILFISGDGQLSFPLNEEGIKGFRAYIKLTGAAAGQ